MARLTKVYINAFEGRKELRVDFDNDRHFSSAIEGNTPAHIGEAFIRMGVMIRKDPVLNEDAGDG